VNGFDDVAKDTLDQWIYYQKNREIKEEAVKNSALL
jgi:hypothetical protein